MDSLSEDIAMSRKNRCREKDLAEYPAESLGLRELGGNQYEVYSLINGSMTRLGWTWCDSRIAQRIQRAQQQVSAYQISAYKTGYFDAVAKWANNPLDHAAIAESMNESLREYLISTSEG